MKKSNFVPLAAAVFASMSISNGSLFDTPTFPNELPRDTSPELDSANAKIAKARKEREEYLKSRRR
jgi:hypothetical protein